MMNACSVHYLHFYIVCDPLKGNDTTYSRYLADLTSINLTKISPNGMLPKKLRWCPSLFLEEVKKMIPKVCY